MKKIILNRIFTCIVLNILFLNIIHAKQSLHLIGLKIKVVSLVHGEEIYEYVKARIVNEKSLDSFVIVSSEREKKAALESLAESQNGTTKDKEITLNFKSSDKTITIKEFNGVFFIQIDDIVRGVVEWSTQPKDGKFGVRDKIDKNRALENVTDLLIASLRYFQKEKSFPKKIEVQENKNILAKNTNNITTNQIDKKKEHSIEKTVLQIDKKEKRSRINFNQNYMNEAKAYALKAIECAADLIKNKHGGNLSVINSAEIIESIYLSPFNINFTSAANKRCQKIKGDSLVKEVSLNKLLNKFEEIKTKYPIEVVTIINSFIVPQQGCKTYGVNVVGGILAVVSIGLHGSICQSTAGNRWFAISPGLGAGFGLGIMATFNAHDTNKDSESNIIDFSGDRYDYYSLVMAIKKKELKDPENLGLGLGITGIAKTAEAKVDLTLFPLPSNYEFVYKLLADNPYGISVD